jgi:Mg2+ and Co2+ transporter CorA
MTTTPVAARDAATGGPGSNPRAHTRLYRDGTCVLHDFPVADISEHLTDPGSVVWLDLCRPTAGDFDMVNTEFGLHELAVEDALHESQRPKLDRYTTHLFLSAYSVTLDAEGARLEASEIAVFITDQALITVHKDDRFDIAPVLARWDASPDLAKHGVAFLLYGLLDHLVDGHFTAVQQLDEGIERLEDLLFDERRAQIETVQRRSFQLRKDLVVLRRVVLPMREVLNTLLRRSRVGNRVCIGVGNGVTVWWPRRGREFVGPILGRRHIAAVHPRHSEDTGRVDPRRRAGLHRGGAGPAFYPGRVRAGWLTHPYPQATTPAHLDANPDSRQEPCERPALRPPSSRPHAPRCQQPLKCANYG